MKNKHSNPPRPKFASSTAPRKVASDFLQSQNSLRSSQQQELQVTASSKHPFNPNMKLQSSVQNFQRTQTGFEKSVLFDVKNQLVELNNQKFIYANNSVNYSLQQMMAPINQVNRHKAQSLILPELADLVNLKMNYAEEPVMESSLINTDNNSHYKVVGQDSVGSKFAPKNILKPRSQLEKELEIFSDTENEDFMKAILDIDLK
ncbi:Hypothetical_protein [Hexamita inflata]|uniref:Hypothetical_protein n=1 Tax=Hexamita inflata TaxID=28002 RepID=A0AA86RST6_9EUKA|nr:Hypothetical protein HINF_LOCUS65092 [Hexamita inflata]